MSRADAELAVGRAAVSEGVVSIVPSPSLDVCFVGPEEKKKKSTNVIRFNLGV